MLRSELRYGPPTFGHLPWQDSVQIITILTLQTKLSVLANAPTGAEGDFYAQSFADVSEIHVAVSGSYDRDELAGSMVELTGELFPAHTGHHHRDVLISCEARDIKLISRFHLSTVEDARVLHRGSGVLLNQQGHILTAAHVASGQALSVRRNLDRHEAHVVALHPSLDIAVLQANIVCDQGMPLREWPWPSLGERVFAAGYPLRGYLGHTISFTEGVVSSDRVNSDGCFHFTAPIQPGSSGGPVFDILGHLLAIVLAQAFPSGRPSADDVRQIQLLNEALPVGLLSDFLRQHKIPHENSPPIHRVDPTAGPAIAVADIARKACVEVESWSISQREPVEAVDQYDLASW